MSDQRSWFTNFTTVHPGTWPVQAVGGHTTFVEGIGDIPIEINIRNQWERGVLTDVLYVPTLQRNLFSVSLAACKNVDTLYTKNGCQMLADGVVLMEGSLEGMLYKLHIRALPSLTHANVIKSIGTSSKADGTRSLAVWHQRLCHLNYPAILAMDCTEAVTGMTLQNKNVPEFCQGCVLGKSHRHSFATPPTRTPSSTPGYLLHADICGPMAHISLGGALFYILFKDDYSGYRHIFVLLQNLMLFGAFKMSTVPFSAIQVTTCRSFALMAAASSPAKSFKTTFHKRVFVMKLQPLTHQSRMASVRGTIGPLWRVSVLFSILVGSL